MARSRSAGSEASVGTSRSYNSDGAAPRALGSCPRDRPQAGWLRRWPSFHRDPLGCAEALPCELRRRLHAALRIDRPDRSRDCAGQRDRADAGRSGRRARRRSAPAAATDDLVALVVRRRRQRAPNGAGGAWPTCSTRPRSLTASRRWSISPARTPSAGPVAVLRSAAAAADAGRRHLRATRPWRGRRAAGTRAGRGDRAHAAHPRQSAAAAPRRRRRAGRVL